MIASGHAGDYLPRLAARGQGSQDGWPDVKHRRVLRRLSLSLLLFRKCRWQFLLCLEALFFIVTSVCSSRLVVSSFSFGVALPPLWRWQARESVSCGPIRSSGRLPGACSSLFPSYATRCRYDVLVCWPLAPALRQVLVAMLAEGAVESPSVLVLAFHSSLSCGRVV